MILFHNFLKSFRWMNFNKSPTNTLSCLLINDRIRLFATETAVQNVKLRFRRKPRDKLNYTVITWVLLVIPASAFCLGTWQVFRKFEKEKINAEFFKKVDQPPVDLPKNLDELKDMEFRKVRVRGKFDHSRELYLGPRPKIDESNKQFFSLLSKSNAGYLVITPFILSDRNLTILVNRGWVPAREKAASKRQGGQITDEVELVGLVRSHQNRVPFGSKNFPEKNAWLHRDLYEMSKAAGTAPVFLDADLSSTVPGGPVGGQTIMGLPNDHLTYVFTWYGLSIASGYLWYLRHFQKVPIVV